MRASAFARADAHPQHTETLALENGAVSGVAKIDRVSMRWVRCEFGQPRLLRKADCTTQAEWAKSLG